MLEGIGVSALFLERPSQCEMDARALVLGQDQRALEMRDRLGRVLPLHVQLGQELLERGIGRIELDAPFQPGEGVVELALAEQRQAEVGVGRSEVGLEPERLEVRRLGLDVPVQGAQGIPEVVVQRRHVRLETDRLLAMRQCLLRLAPVEEHLTQVGPGRRE